MALAWVTAIPAAAGEDASAGGTLSPGQSFSERSGAALYANVCQGCHMPGGTGAVGAGAYPALARNGDLASADYVVQVIVNGQRGMPSFGWGLDDAQVAAVATYVRTHFGNADAEPVTEAAVARARP